MVKIHNYEDYKAFLNDTIAAMPKGGRGQFLKISKYLNVHSTLISQILSGHKDFTFEQAFRLCSYFGLGPLESDYFMAMVQFRKAGTQDLRDYHFGKMKILAGKFKEVASRVAAKKSLSENDKALYYSDWSYMAVWLLCGMDQVKSPDDISLYLDLPLERTKGVLDFLLRTGLVEEDASGDLKMGQSRTHLDRKDPLIAKHHTNWRLKAIENFHKLPAEELGFSAPLTVSKDDFQKIKNEILELIEKASKIVSKSDPDTLACLNIDFFSI